MDADGAFALQHLTAVMHVNRRGTKRDEMLHTRDDEEPVAIECSVEGSEGASDGEDDGRGTPFYARRRHNTTQELELAAVTRSRKSERRKTSLEITCHACLALGVVPEAGSAVDRR